MAKEKLIEFSTNFAVEIINLVKVLNSDKEFIISNQIGRSGTSIGANIHEAQYAQSKADFISKLQIALKESNETSYWLKILLKTNYISSDVHSRLELTCGKIRKMLISSIMTAKSSM